MIGQLWLGCYLRAPRWHEINVSGHWMSWALARVEHNVQGPLVILAVVSLPWIGYQYHWWCIRYGIAFFPTFDNTGGLVSMIVHLDIRFLTLIVFLYLLHTSSSALYSLFYVYFALHCCPVFLFSFSHFLQIRVHLYHYTPSLYFRSAAFEWTSVSCSISYLSNLWLWRIFQWACTAIDWNRWYFNKYGSYKGYNWRCSLIVLQFRDQANLEA